MGDAAPGLPGKQLWLTPSDLQGPPWDSSDNPVDPPLAESLLMQKLQLLSCSSEEAAEQMQE